MCSHSDTCRIRKFSRKDHVMEPFPYSFQKEQDDLGIEMME